MNKEIQQLLNDDLTAIRQRCQQIAKEDPAGDPYQALIGELADMIETLARILATKINGDEYTRQTERSSNE